MAARKMPGTDGYHEVTANVKSRWIVLLPLGNIYMFRSPDEYDIFRANETLHDSVLDISIPLNEVFE